MKKLLCVILSLALIISSATVINVSADNVDINSAKIYSFDDFWNNKIFGVYENESGTYEYKENADGKYPRTIVVDTVRLPQSGNGAMLGGKTLDPSKIANDDTGLFKIVFRKLSGEGIFKVQLQDPQWIKPLFKEVKAEEEWTTVYVPFVFIPDATGLAIRTALHIQKIEVAEVSIYNFKNTISSPALNLYTKEQLDALTERGELADLGDAEKLKFEEAYAKKQPLPELTNPKPDKITVKVNENELDFDVAPTIIDGRTLVPLRKIFESLDCSVDWDDATKTVTAKRGDKEIRLTIGSKVAYINGAEVTLDVGAQIIDSRTLVPVRFISEALGEKVEWLDPYKMVKITYKNENGLYKGLAPLVSDFHRQVPTEFTKSKDLSDVFYFGEEDSAKGADLSSGGVQFGGNELLDTASGTGEKTTITKTAEGTYIIDVPAAVEPVSSAVVSVGAFKDALLNNTSTGDVCVMSFNIRTLSGGNEKGVGKITAQIQGGPQFAKTLFEDVSATSVWRPIKLAFLSDTVMCHLAFRTGHYAQKLEISDFKVVNYKDTIKKSDVVSAGDYIYQYPQGAQWREDAYKRIEELRKGDFRVVVKDKEGNVIPDAKVTFDMFEHEFKFGTALTSGVALENDKTEAIKVSENFNAVSESSFLKWELYLKNLGAAKRNMDAAKNAGVKYFRGHSLVWEVKDKTGSGNRMVPEYIDGLMTSKELVDKEVKEWIDYLTEEYRGYVYEWDVFNEIVGHTKFRSLYGDGMLIDWLNWTKAKDPQARLYYNDCYDSPLSKSHEQMFEKMDFLYKNNAPLDGIGLQSHYEGDIAAPQDVYNVYERIANNYNYRISVTEFSRSDEDEVTQASYLRDMMIMAFSHRNVDSFYMWGFRDKTLYPSCPLYTLDWQPKLGLKVWQDLVYNKWWTDNEVATSGNDGMATIRGYYGDYDVTVEKDGKTKTVMAAFHTGYENVLEIVLD